MKSLMSIVAVVAAIALANPSTGQQIQGYAQQGFTQSAVQQGVVQQGVVQQGQIQQGQWTPWQPVQPGQQIIQQGQWTPWQPVQPGQPVIQQGQWTPWQPVQPGQQIVQPGQWTPWQPVQPGQQVQPGQGQVQQTEVRTVYKTVTRQVQVYNPATGQYETRTIEESVPVQVGTPTPGGVGVPVPVPAAQNNSFTVTFTNRSNSGFTVTIGNQSQRLEPGQSWQVSAKDGQNYGYSGDPYQSAPGQMVGGGVYRGVISSNQRTITLGGG